MAIQMPTDDQMAMADRIIAKAWADPAFKGALLSNPRETLAAEGIEMPAGMTFQVVENTATNFTFVLPAKPAIEVSDEVLEGVAGGGQQCCCAFSCL